MQKREGERGGGHEPGPLRPGVARDLVGRLLTRPQELRWDWLVADGREAVPFVLPGRGVVREGTAEGTGPEWRAVLAPELAERTVFAALGLGADHLLACRTQPEYLNEPVAVVPQHPETLTQQSARFGPTDFIVVPPGFGAALLVTTLGYGVAAGSPQFVEAALGEDVEAARRGFAERAWDARGDAPALTETAYVFGCAMSGPHHAPAWKAWSGPSQVPPNSGLGDQLALMRQAAAGSIGAETFVPAWLEARDREISAGEHATGSLAAALRQVLYAVDDYVPDALLRGPEDLDDAGVVDAVRSALRALSAPPPHARS